MVAQWYGIGRATFPILRAGKLFYSKKERELSLDFSLSASLKMGQATVSYCAGVLLADVGAPADFGVAK